MANEYGAKEAFYISIKKLADMLAKKTGQKAKAILKDESYDKTGLPDQDKLWLY